METGLSDELERLGVKGGLNARSVQQNLKEWRGSVGRGRPYQDWLTEFGLELSGVTLGTHRLKPDNGVLRVVEVDG